jgi:hypothetical protein
VKRRVPALLPARVGQQIDADVKQRVRLCIYGWRRCASMSSTPETRASLLIRVRDPADQAAWHEFVEIYRPVILRLARQKGMQEADADDVAQQVLVAVGKAASTTRSVCSSQPEPIWSITGPGRWTSTDAWDALGSVTTCTGTSDAI